MIVPGLPKAAIIKHSRYLFASYCLFCMGLTYEDDILYSVLPMYHSAFHVCLGVTITEGNTAVTRKKFSATKFWEDCVKNNVTVCRKQSSSSFTSSFSVWPIYWRDCKISILQSCQQVWKSASDQDDVWKWIETSDLGSVCSPVQHQADQWILWINWRQLQLWQLYEQVRTW